MPPVLSGAAFAAESKLFSLDEALALLDSRLGPVAEAETLPVSASAGRFLAEDVVARTHVPPFDNSAVDGWAVRSADLPAEGEVRLRVAGRSAAGHPFEGPLAPGAAIRILTGAPMPAGADAVAMQEHCRAEDGAVIVPGGLAAGTNRRRAGEDVAQGAAALPRGTRLGPAELGLAAATGHAEVRVHRQLRAAVFSTGDEVRDPGAPLPPGCLYDSNRRSASAFLTMLGCAVTDLGILPDRVEAIRGALAAAAPDHDLLLTSGGVSVGDEDHVRPAVEALGTLHFWKLAIKPGKPVALGEVRGRAFIGLPGNPVAGLVTLMLVARPVVLKLMGARNTAPVRYPVTAGFSLARRPGRREWLRARVAARDGGLAAELYPRQGAGVLSSMVWADGLVEILEDCGGVSIGDTVSYIPFAEVTR
ncbi:MAG: molybdopterin molybdotransferase MoeA [Magnetospirillum sp.]|nr:molybdopterin molybdotransferase MoeA [Magnetospirillum sp.]